MYKIPMNYTQDKKPFKKKDKKPQTL